MTMNLAMALWQAREQGAAIEVAPADYPETMAAAYAIQHEQHEIAGLDIAGWKIGATSQWAQDTLGIRAPFAAPIFAPTLYQSGSDVPIAIAQKNLVEAEYLVRLGDALPYRDAPYSAQEVSARVADLVPAFEVVASRTTADFAGSGPLVVADGGMAHAVVQGTGNNQWQDIDLTHHEISVSKNGAHNDSGAYSAMIWPHPFDAVAWLAQQPVLQQGGLKAGDVVMTGALAGVVEVTVGDAMHADFGGVGQVSARFVEYTL